MRNIPQPYQKVYSHLKNTSYTMKPLQVLHLLHHMEKLKGVTRHSWISTGRQEGVAEHAWRMALMAMVLAPKLKQKVNLCKVIKMAVVHDLSEIDIGDVPVFRKAKRAAHSKLEHKNMLGMKRKFKDPIVDEMYHLWLEYEVQNTKEAKFVKALDKIEVHLQHNEAPIKTWADFEYPMGLYITEKWCKYDPFLKEINDLLVKEARIKIIKESKKDIKKIELIAEKLKISQG